MNKCRNLMTTSLLIVSVVPARTQPREAFKAKELLQKDLNAYAGGDLILSVGEITIAPGASGSRHRHPGPTFVYVLEGAVEIELQGAPPKIYHAGETVYEDPHQLHIATKNASKTEPSRILVYHLSRKGEPLTQLDR